MTKPRIAVCFFGITRSLGYTVRTIDRQILRPISTIGEHKVFCHFFDQDSIVNERSGERGILKRDEHKLLSPDWLELEEPDTFLGSRGFDDIKAFGDAWEDGFRSLRNLVHQLHSLDKVTRAAEEWHPDLFVFVRPDLAYHHSLKRVLLSALRCEGPVAFLPDWQHWEGGVNDRFAVCLPQAAHVYGHRIDQMAAYCNHVRGPLHGERLLKYTLIQNQIDLRLFWQKASRIRAGGTLWEEDFSTGRAGRIQRKLARLKFLVVRALWRMSNLGSSRRA